MLSLIFIIGFIFSGIVNPYAYNKVRESYPRSELNFFAAEELYKYDDVIGYMDDNGYRYESETNTFTIIKDAKYADEYLAATDVIKINEYGIDISEDEINKLIERYDLERPDEILDTEKSFVLVEREIESQTGDFVVSNVWYFNHVHSDDGFAVNVLNIGLDPLDSMSGTIGKYNLNGTSYVKSMKSHHFGKSQVKSGLVTKWEIDREAVAESFEYVIEVTEDGVSIVYHNKGKHDEIRYYFQVAPFNDMLPLGGHRHHFVSKKALDDVQLISEKGPAIRMRAADHYKTPSYGNQTWAQQEVQLMRQGKYRELLQMEADSFKTLPDPEGRYSSLQVKYFYPILEALALGETYFGIN